MIDPSRPSEDEPGHVPALALDRERSVANLGIYFGLLLVIPGIVLALRWEGEGRGKEG